MRVEDFLRTRANELYASRFYQIIVLFRRYRRFLTLLVAARVARRQNANVAVACVSCRLRFRDFRRRRRFRLS